MIGREYPDNNNDNKPKGPIVIRRPVICKFCEVETTHIIGTWPNYDKADLTPGKEMCGNCVEKSLQDKIIKTGGERAQQLLNQRIEGVERKADIKGMANAFKNNEQKDFGHLFKSPGSGERDSLHANHVKKDKLV